MSPKKPVQRLRVGNQQSTSWWYFSIIPALPGQHEVAEHGHCHFAELRQARAAGGLARDSRPRDRTQLRIAGNWTLNPILLANIHLIWLSLFWGAFPLCLASRVENFATVLSWNKSLYLPIHGWGPLSRRYQHLESTLCLTGTLFWMEQAGTFYDNIDNACRLRENFKACFQRHFGSKSSRTFSNSGRLVRKTKMKLSTYLKVHLNNPFYSMDGNINNYWCFSIRIQIHLKLRSACIIPAWPRSVHPVRRRWQLHNVRQGYQRRPKEQQQILPVLP